MIRDAGHRRRFDVLFEAHRLDIASYCSWRTASRPDAEDAVAEVFLVAWRKIETVPAGDAARAWLSATARRVTANQRRSRRRRDALAERLAQERLLDASRTVAATTDEATVHAALARLGDRDREVSVSNEDPGRAGRADLVIVDGTLYGPDPATADGWFELGSPASIDPDSGTTPDEYLATVREDAGGDAFRRITETMTDLTTSPGDDGSVVYRGTVPAGVLAWETGTKGGAPIRVLPYGYVAHDDASDPAAAVDVRITVRADGTIEEIHAAWGAPRPGATGSASATSARPRRRPRRRTPDGCAWSGASPAHRRSRRPAHEARRSRLNAARTSPAPRPMPPRFTPSPGWPLGTPTRCISFVFRRFDADARTSRARGRTPRPQLHPYAGIQGRVHPAA